MKKHPVVPFSLRSGPKGQSHTPLPAPIAKILRAALAASDPQSLILEKLSLRKEILRAGGVRINLADYGRVYVIGAGKASGAMALGLEKVLGGRITDGLVVVKYGHGARLSKIRTREAGHPVPDQAGMEGALEIVSLLKKVRQGDLVIILLSGGGSALMPLPVEGVTLEEKQKTTQMLLKSGATIEEINAVRKHLSRIKGGQLARLAAPARILSLILSDVPGNPLDTIASGPTVSDSSTYRQAMDVMRKYQLWGDLPAAVRRHLSHGCSGNIPETVKPGEPALKSVQNIIIGDNRLALKAAESAARSAGFRTHTLTSFLKGEAREVACVFGSIARELRAAGKRRQGKFCVLASGETTVTVRGEGLGGRCQEFALAAAIEISGLGRTLVAAFGTDGTDGPTDSAGAYADDQTVRKADLLGLNPLRALRENSSYPFFKALGQHIITGPTFTNLNDLYLVITY